jgi:hypothetical protein
VIHRWLIGKAIEAGSATASNPWWTISMGVTRRPSLVEWTRPGNRRKIRKKLDHPRWGCREDKIGCGKLRWVKDYPALAGNTF